MFLFLSRKVAVVVVDVVDVAVLVFVPCELRPGAILAHGMQALGE